MKTQILAKDKFLRSVKKRNLVNKEDLEITDKIFETLKIELGVTRKEITSNSMFTLFKTARVHFAGIAIHMGLTEEILAYATKRILMDARKLMDLHQERMNQFGDSYKKDHEEILSYINGTGVGLGRGVELQILFSRKDFLDISREIQTKAPAFDYILRKFENMSKLKNPDLFEIFISQRKLYDLVTESGLSKKNISDIVNHVLAFAT